MLQSWQLVAQKLKSARPHSARQLRGAQSLEDNSIVHTIWGSRAHVLAWLTAHVRFMPSHRPTVGRNVAEKGLKPFSFCFCVKPQLRHYFPSVLGRTNCNWVSMGVCWVATLWRLPSGTPQWRERAFVHYFGGAVNTQKLCFHSQKTSHFKKQWWPPVLTTPNAFRALCATGDAWSTAAYFSVRALISVLLCS